MSETYWIDKYRITSLHWEAEDIKCKCLSCLNDTSRVTISYPKWFSKEYKVLTYICLECFDKYNLNGGIPFDAERKVGFKLFYKDGLLGGYRRFIRNIKNVIKEYK